MFCPPPPSLPPLLFLSITHGVLLGLPMSVQGRHPLKPWQTTSGYTAEEKLIIQLLIAPHLGWDPVRLSQDCAGFWLQVTKAVVSSWVQGPQHLPTDSISQYPSPPLGFHILSPCLPGWMLSEPWGGVGKDFDIDVPSTGSNYSHLLSSLWPANININWGWGGALFFLF